MGYHLFPDQRNSAGDNEQNSNQRIITLLLLAVLILAAGWLSSTKPNMQPSSYFWADGKLLRSQDSRAAEGVRLAAGMTCADTPPELAAFFHLPLPMNHADQAALIRLPDIGPKLAEAIIMHRDGTGGFAGPDDLIKVKGIGPKRSARLLPLLCFD